MHKCGKRGCQNLVDSKYRFCWEHRNTPYKDICKIHGEQLFVAGQCPKCKSLKMGIYRLYKRNGKYFFNKSKTPITKSSKYYFLKPYFEFFVNRDKTFHIKNIKRIYDGPGIYGIFLKDQSKKNQLGQCLYVGQSVRLSARVNQHKKNLRTASNHLKGVRSKAKKNYKDWKKMIPKEKRKVENKYYDIINQHYMKDLKFVSLIKFDDAKWDRLTEEQKKIMLCLGEQLMLDVFSPKENTFASRPSYK